jgi:hypothetical protein
VAREVRERQTEGGLLYLSFGEGPPLVVAGAAYTLSEQGREFQLRVAALSAAGEGRVLSVMQAPDVTESRFGIRGDSSRSRPRLRLSSAAQSGRIYCEQAPSGSRCVCT